MDSTTKRDLLDSIPMVLVAAMAVFGLASFFSVVLFG